MRATSLTAMRTLGQELGQPGSGAVVMATGIVSIALSLGGYPVWSDVWFAFAAIAWVVLALVVVVRLVGSRHELVAQASSPAALTGVAATAMLGSRLVTFSLPAPSIACLAMAAFLWSVLIARLVWLGKLPRTGGSFMLTVSTQSIAVLCAALSSAEHASWLLYGACVAWVAGAGLYPLVLARLDLRELVTATGDQWVAGGALAITTLAAGELLLAGGAGVLRAVAPALRDVTLAAWAASLVWLPALIAGEIANPRLSYHSRRWSTVFPLGMYAACSYEVARAAGVGAGVSFARIVVWIAVVVWLVVAVGMVRRGADKLRPCS